MNNLSLLWQNQTKVSVDQKIIAAHLEAILRRLGEVAKVEIELTLVGDPAITKLKQQFLGLNEPTDVLSFPNPSRDLTLSGVEEPSNLLGSIVISVDTATHQARDASIELIDELKMLAGHGLLHLLGYGHR